MIKPLALAIGLRYMRAKKRNQFVSFISLSSMLGIGLGVTVLITVLSVMNGFDDEIHKRFFGMAPEITISGADNRIADWPSLSKEVQKFSDVKAVAPFIGLQGMITHDGQAVPMMLTGILPEKETQISHLEKKMLLGSLKNLEHFGIVLGQSLAENLGVLVGDKVVVMVPEADMSPAGMIPRFKRFTVAGIFKAGTGFNFDTKLAFVHLHDAQKLLQYGQDVSGLKLKIKEVYAAPMLSRILSNRLGEQYFVSNWTDQFGSFFQAVKMEKTMMFLILILIIAVAAFNLVSSLVMVVNDKQAEIAILRTLGATPRLILWIFITQGMLVGVCGLGLGLLGGLTLASHATAIVDDLQHLLHMKFISSNIYFVDYLPSKISWDDVWQVCVVALSMSFLATIYPAWRASKTLIAEALHYE